MDLHASTELIQAAAAAVAAGRLFYLNLADKFRALFAYLVFVAGINLVSGLVSDTSVAYFWGYIALEAVKCVLGVLAVRELFALSFGNYPGIRTLGRWVIYGGVGLSLAASLLVTGFFWQGAASGRAHSHLFYIEVSIRAVVFSLAVVIISNLLLLSKYPLHLSRNTLVSSVFFSAVFLSEACRLLIDSLAPQLFDRYIDASEAAFICVCLVGWALMLSPATESAPAQVRYSSSHEDHLLDQLNALNQLMTRSVRR